MEDGSAPITFASMPIPFRKLSNAGVSRYRVYRNPKEFDVIEAANAADAARQAGKGVYKLVRETRHTYNQIALNLLQQSEECPKVETSITEISPPINGPLIIELAKESESPADRVFQELPLRELFARAAQFSGASESEAAAETLDEQTPACAPQSLSETSAEEGIEEAASHQEPAAPESGVEEDIAVLSESEVDKLLGE